MQSHNNTDHVNKTDIECVYKLHITSKVTMKHAIVRHRIHLKDSPISHCQRLGGPLKDKKKKKAEYFKGKTMMSLPLKHS